MIAKRYKKKFKVCLAFLILFLFLGAALGGVFIAEYVVDFSVRYVPAYAKESLSPVLEKETWTDADYDFLFRQTGLGKPALDAFKETPEELFKFQDAFFYEGENEHGSVSPVTKQDKFNYGGSGAPVAPLEAGDVLLSSSCHSLGWRHGHAALALDASGTVLESVAVGIPSRINYGGTYEFRFSPAFMILRLKDVSQEARAEIAEEARRTLVNVPYSLTVGFFAKKDQGTNPAETHCSHLVWQAYKNFGYEIDPNGGPLVSPRDIARCPLFEIVQINGFDPDKLW